MTDSVARARVLDASPSAVAEAARVLRRGGLVAFPTETVYGLGADATDDRAVAAIFAAKRRPRFNPLIVHVPDIAAARRLVAWSDMAALLAKHFWPGPLSLVLRRRADSPLSLLVSAGLDSIAVRVPAHPVALRLLGAAGMPVAAPSANRSGEVSPTRAEHVAQSLGEAAALVLDGGPCAVGLESTVVGLAGKPALLRPGGVAQEDLEALVGPLAMAGEGDMSRSPGMLKSHYAPSLPLRLDAAGAGPGEALLAFGPDTPDAAVTLNLSSTGDLMEAAANLFAHLRALDRPELAGIAAMPVPERGPGLAINDRLRRAAAPRP